MKNNTVRGFGRKAVAVLGAVTIGLISAVAVAGPASAAPNIDANAKATLTIHKYAQPQNATSLPNNGSALTADQLKDLTALKGVEFKAERITNIDLTTDAGWDKVNGLQASTVVANAGNAYPRATALTGATAANGTLSFSNLDLGLYLVTETGHGTNQIVDSIDPFLVTLPLSTGASNWLYNVNVYPKNAVTELNKTVPSSQGVGLGNNITWTITAKVPYLAANQNPLTQFRIQDVLDSRLSHVSSTVALSGTNQLVAGDYAVTPPTAGTNGGTFDVTFSAAGLTKLSANQGQTVTITLTTKVTGVGNGTINNNATLAVNNNTAITSPTATTSFGALKITSDTTAGGATSALVGARYSVYANEADALAKRNPISVNGETVFTTGADGSVTVPGLGTGSYWVSEIDPPAGYTASVGAAAVTTGTVVAGVTTPTLYPYHYAQVPAWMLPLTGGDGGMWFSVGGAALLVTAFGAVLVAARRRRSVVETA